MSIDLTKADLRKALGNDAAVAAFFGISRAAVAQWKDDEPIPELRRLQAVQKRPDLFGRGDGHLHRSLAAPKGSEAAKTTLAISVDEAA